MALDDDIAILAGAPILSLLERDACRLLAFAAQTRMLAAGDVLFRKGEVSDAAYVVRTGTIALDTRDDGSPTSFLATPGALIHELALFVDTQRPATAIARGPGSVVKISRELMARVLVEFPDSAERIREVMAERVRGLSQDLMRVGQRLRSLDGH